MAVKKLFKELIPEVQPFQGPAEVDPEDLRIQALWRKIKEESDVAQMNRAIEDVKREVAEDPENWQDKFKAREGVDFWKVGEEPSIKDLEDLEKAERERAAFIAALKEPGTSARSRSLACGLHVNSLFSYGIHVDSLTYSLEPCGNTCQ